MRVFLKRNGRKEGRKEGGIKGGRIKEESREGGKEEKMKGQERLNCQPPRENLPPS